MLVHPSPLVTALWGSALSVTIRRHWGRLVAQSPISNDTARLTPSDWLAGWTYRKQLTVDHDQVDAPLVDFPIYVNINADVDFHAALATGYDVRFTQADGQTLLNYDRVFWTGGNGSAATARFRVNLPTISPTADTQFYIYYGNPAAPDGQDKAATWTDYEAVYHGNDAGDTSTVADATGNHNGSKSAPNHPTQTTTGKVHFAQDFERSNPDRVNCGDFLNTAPQFFLTCWTKPESNGDDHDLLVKGKHMGTSPVVLWRDDSTTDHYAMLIRDDDDDYSGVQYTTGLAVPPGSWQHFACTFDGDEAGAGEIRFYLDGQLDSGSPHATPAVDEIKTSVDHVWIGSDIDSFQTLDGLLCEVQIRTTIPTNPAAWIKLLFENVDDYPNTVSHGPEET